MTARYAVYFVPRRDDPLMVTAQRWLGRDVYTNGATPQRPLDSIGSVHELTASPRHYGFHATLTAPFELNSDANEKSLLNAAEKFAGDQRSFPARFAVSTLGSFIALTAREGTSPLAALHAACLREFHNFRRPLSEFDRDRRLKAPLTAKQIEHLDKWGYPYVLDQFRFHMTLTGSIKDSEQRKVVESALQREFCVHLDFPQQIDGIAVCRQNRRKEDFLVVERFAFPA